MDGGGGLKDLDNLLESLIRPPRDLFISIGVSVLFLITYLLIPGWIGIRVLLGLPLLFVIPGLLFVELINSPIDSGNRALRLAMCFAFSILLASGLVLLLSLFHNFYTNPFIFSLSFLIWLEAGLLFYLRDYRGRDSSKTSMFFLGRAHEGDAILVIGSAIILILAAVILGNMVPEKDFRGTSFYLLDSNGLASDYPVRLLPDEEGTVIVVVVCDEKERTDYNVSIWLEENMALELLDQHSLSLAPGERNEQTFSFSLSNYGLFRLAFKLKTDNILLEELYLWIEVSETITEVTLPGTTGTGEPVDPIGLSIDTTYTLAINITSHELNDTSYQIAISLYNDINYPQEDFIEHWVDWNQTYHLNGTSLLFANQAIAPNRSAHLELNFFMTKLGTYSIYVRFKYMDWPSESIAEKSLWIQVS